MTINVKKGDMTPQGQQYKIVSSGNTVKNAFTEETIDIGRSEITSLGQLQANKAQLETQKTNLQTQIDEVQAKIDAIGAL